MEYHVGLDGRDFSKLEPQKQRLVDQFRPVTPEGWHELAALVLEVIGIRQAVRMGDPRRWRQALSELNTLPLPPLNLPLLLWDLYQSHPFEGVTLRMQDGAQLSVPDWSRLYYCWHSRWFALWEEKMMKFFDATTIVGGESIRPPGTQTTIRERLSWIERAEKPIDFVVRTRQGRGFIVHGTNGFRLDPSGSLLVLKGCEDQPVEILPLSDIVSVVVADADSKALIKQLQQRLQPIPFVPFHVVLLHGGRYTVHRAEDVLVTSTTLFLGQAGESSEVHDQVLEIPLAWIDHFEALPPPG